MPDYQKGKIYKLWSPEGNEIYIGSTVQPLYARFHTHKVNMTCSSKILFEKYNDVRIELIECCPCDNKEELNKKEGEYIRELDCVNKRVAGRTRKEYYENNKEKIKEYKKEWCENNKEKVKEWCENNKEHKKEYDKEYCSKNFTCECGRTIRLAKKSRHERSKIHHSLLAEADLTDSTDC